jgi:hypothetical protein
VTPGSLGHQAGPGNHLGQDGVGGHHSFPFPGCRTRIGAALVTGGVDQEQRFHGTQVVKQKVEPGVVEGATGERDKGMAAPAQFAGEGAADEAAGAEEDNHVIFLTRRTQS